MEFNQEVPTASDGCDWLLNQCDNAIDNDQEDHTLAMWNHIGKGYSLLVWFEDDEYILFYCSCTWLQELVNAHFSTRSRFDFKNSKTSSCLHCVKSDQIRSFFWSVFSSIWTEYGEILRISPYSVRMQEITDQKKLLIWILFTQWWHLRKLAANIINLCKMRRGYYFANVIIWWQYACVSKECVSKEWVFQVFLMISLTVKKFKHLDLCANLVHLLQSY